jgi:hypothetical protein
MIPQALVHGLKSRTMKMEAADSSETLTIYTELHGVIFQTTLLFIPNPNIY